MFRPGPPRLPSSARIAAAWWMAFVLLLQGWSMTYQATAMASGTEVCSAAGVAKRVDGQGNPLPASHAGHDCCCAATSLPGPVSLDIALAAFAHQTPSGLPGAGRLSAESLTPLSRGPPALS